MCACQTHPQPRGLVAWASGPSLAQLIGSVEGPIILYNGLDPTQSQDLAEGPAHMTWSLAQPSSYAKLVERE